MAAKSTHLALKVLEQCRAEMVQDFMSHKPEIYAPSFKYETSLVLLKLAREKYFTMWLSNHWQIFNQIISQLPIEEQRNMETHFSRVFLALLGKWSVLKTTDAYQVSLGKKLIDDMVVALNELIKSGDKSDMKRNQLEITLEKNRVLFDREFKRLSEE